MGACTLSIYIDIHYVYVLLRNERDDECSTGSIYKFCVCVSGGVHYIYGTQYVQYYVRRLQYNVKRYYIFIIIRPPRVTNIIIIILSV